MRVLVAQSRAQREVKATDGAGEMRAMPHHSLLDENIPLFLAAFEGRIEPTRTLPTSTPSLRVIRWIAILRRSRLSAALSFSSATEHVLQRQPLRLEQRMNFLAHLYNALFRYFHFALLGLRYQFGELFVIQGFEINCHKFLVVIKKINRELYRKSTLTFIPQLTSA